MATIKDVAKAAGVSIATVSRAFNGNASLSEATRLKVMEAAQAIGYRRDRVAAAMRTGRTNSIGLIVGDLMNPFYATLAYCVEREVNKAGSALLIATAHEDCDTQAAAIRSLIEQRVDGLLVIPPATLQEGWEIPGTRDVPIVALDRVAPNPDVPSVVIDAGQAFTDLAEHLKTQGYQRPAFINGPQNTYSGRLRRKQVERAFDQAQLGPIMVEESEYDAISAAQVARSLFALYHPDVVICDGNQMGMGVLRLARSLGIKVGKDLGLAAIDDTPWFTAMTPTITVIDQPLDQLASLGVAILMRSINGAAYTVKPGEVLVGGQAVLITRESTERYTE